MLRADFLARRLITFSEKGIFFITKSMEEKRGLRRIRKKPKNWPLEALKAENSIINKFYTDALFSRDMPRNIDKLVYCSLGGKILACK